MTALDIARQMIKEGLVRESQGKNRSSVIDEINREVGNPLGSPYCAAGVSYWIQHSVNKLATVAVKAFNQAGKLIFGYSGGSQSIKAWLKKHDLLFTDPDHLLKCTAACAGWTNADGEHGHIFLVGERFTDADGHVIAIGTEECNTSPQTKDRDGEGGYHLKRTIEELRDTHPNFWFGDLSNVIGAGAGLTEWWG